MKNTFFFAFFVLFASLNLGFSADTGKPNILFILTDDQRWDSLGCYGNTIIRTPNLDKLAAKGALLDAFYVASPLCCPSRAIFLSGLLPHQSGIDANAPLDFANPAKSYVRTLDFLEGSRTIATVLNQAGYITGFIGKAHLGGEPKRWGFKEYPVYFPFGEAQYHDPKLVVNGKAQIVPGYISTLFADSAIRFMEAHQKDQWFLWLAMTAPHSPFKQTDKNLYENVPFPPPPGWPKNEPFKKEKWLHYYSAITLADLEIGRVLKKLEELGIDKNTFIFFVSDNGYMWGSHGQPAKSVWYEESVRVPAIACWPSKMRAGTKISGLVSSIDVFPTIVEAAGLTSISGLPGISILPVLLENRPANEFVFSEVNSKGSWQMIRTDRWKYVNVLKKVGQVGQKKPVPEGDLLFDLKNDPGEQTDLSDSAQHTEVLAKLKAILNEWMKKTDNGPKKPSTKVGPPEF